MKNIEIRIASVVFIIALFAILFGVEFHIYGDDGNTSQIGYEMFRWLKFRSSDLDWRGRMRLFTTIKPNIIIGFLFGSLYYMIILFVNNRKLKLSSDNSNKE